MANMLEKSFKNEELGLELKSYLNKQQNVWFLGKDLASIIGYSNVRKAIWNHVDSEDKQLICWRTQNGNGNNNKCWGPQFGSGNNYDLRGKYYRFVNESGFYSLVLSSKLETAKKFKK